MTTTRSDTAARMMVLALEASLPKVARTQMSTWRLLGTGTTEVRSDDLVGILTESRKPVACLVVPTDSPAGLTTLRLTATDDLDNLTIGHAAGDSKLIDSIRRKYAVADTVDMISFRNRYTGASLLVSLEDLNTWLRDYYLKTYTLVVRDPDETERHQGAVTVVEIGSTEGIRADIEWQPP